MAPFIGPTREELIELLGKWRPRLPITLGLYEPQAVVERAGEVWRIRRLVKDEATVSRIGAERLAAGQSFMPEHTWVFREDGPVLVEAGSKQALIEAVRRMKWTFSQ